MSKMHITQLPLPRIIRRLRVVMEEVSIGLTVEDGEVLCIPDVRPINERYCGTINATTLSELQLWEL